MDTHETETIVSSVAVNESVQGVHEANKLKDTTESINTTNPHVHDDVAQLNELHVKKEGEGRIKSDVSESREASEERKSANLPAGTSTSSYVPPVKRFNAVNINKKFLAKNQSLPLSIGSHTTSNSSGKQTGIVAKPAPQTAASHSRLVTTKLTAAPISTSPGPGWSRPSSVTPPVPSTSSTSVIPGSGTSSAAVSTPHTPSQVPSTGKLVQPQTRISLRQKVEGQSGAKLAWRNVPLGSTNASLNVQSDFPTAAEAAQGRALKLVELKAASDASAAQKQAMLETADAFRGVHLDPNAHHWDEMEEDDNDDFLGGIIEFGDGRQYTINVNEGTKIDSLASGGTQAQDLALHPELETHVSKEERFVDDFDRSWPRSSHDHGIPPHQDTQGNYDKQHDPGLRSRSSLSEASSTFSAHSPISSRDGAQSRVLFNERSNRMEPYSTNNRPGPGNVNGFQSSSHPQPVRRNGLPEGAAHFPNSRLERDAPPHGTRPHVQVLQKAGRSDDSRRVHESRRDDLESSTVVSQSSGDGMLEHHRSKYEWAAPGSTYAGSNVHVQQSVRDPSASRDAMNGASSVASSDDLGSRYSSSRTFPHSAEVPRELERQVPPHLTHSQTPALREGAHNSREFHTSSTPSVRQDKVADEVSAAEPSSDSRTSNEPSEHVVINAQAQTSPDDVEALRKAFLAESAERAKKRRQQEEEERAKAQERARKKAAELEAKFSTSKTEQETSEPGPALESAPIHTVQVDSMAPNKRPTEAEVLNVIEEAIKAAAPIEKSTNEVSGKSIGVDALSARAAWNRTTLSKDHLPAPAMSSSASLRRQPIVPVPEQSESWRAKSKPAVISIEQTKTDQSQIISETSTLPMVQAFELSIDDSVDVIDFSDIGQLIGEEGTPKASLSRDRPENVVRPHRPTASDFFDRRDKQGVEQWRQAGVPSKPMSLTTEQTVSHSTGNPVVDAKRGPISSEQESSQSTAPVSHSQSPMAVPLAINDNSLTHVPPSPGFSRPHRNPVPSYREAPLSALDDTMSRIKGALDGMHSSLSGQGNRLESKEFPAIGHQASISATHGQVPLTPTLPKREKWLPPALRPPGSDRRPNPTEPFEFTRLEPPRSPLPQEFVIRIPKDPRRFEPLPKKQFSHSKYATSGPVRWEILSFDPPVEGMTKRSLLINDVLFKRPPIGRNRKFKVVLPKSRRSLRHTSDLLGAPRINVPTGVGFQARTTTTGAFGRPRAPDQGSWRVPTTTNALDETGVDSQSAPTVLNVTSRSPPPETSAASRQEQGTTSKDQTHNRMASKSKVPPKMLDGSDVAFYRDVRTQSTASDGTPKVTFTVNSELEVEADVITAVTSRSVIAEIQETGKGHSRIEPAVSILNSGASAEKSQVLVKQPEVASSEVSSTTRTNSASQPSLQGTSATQPPQKSDSPLRSLPVTPPPQSISSSWSKSPARVPDPEHLKAVWSQASEKDSAPTVNSLKEIADDLTTVPFSILEVKSEDGGTPPPQVPVAPPSRMSASEVTRAFQTVPSAPSNNSPLHTNPFNPGLSPPLGVHDKALRQAPVGFPQPPSAQHIARPHYMGYPASMESHSPSPPTLVYSHVMPNGMQSSPSGTPYGQPLWMQLGPQMVRPQPPSPYNPSLMPYHMPSAQNGVYPSSVGAPSSQGSPAPYPSAPPSQMLVSPVLPQAAPVPPHMMYATSPMLVPVPPPGGAPVQPHPYPGVVGMGRNNVPLRNPIDSRQPPNTTHPQQQASRFPVHNSGFSQVPPQTFVRPSW